MEALINQIRVRFSRGDQEEPSRSREQRRSLQKTHSFKGEKKRTQNWFWSKFSTQMSRDHDFIKEREHATAVAAAAFAITSLEESRIAPKRQTSVRPEASLTKQKSKKEDKPTSVEEPGRVSKWFSGESSMKGSASQDGEVPVITPAATENKKPEKPLGVPSIKKSSTFPDGALKNNDTMTTKTTEKVTGHTPCKKRTPTADDEILKNATSIKPEGPGPKADLPPIKPPPKPDTPPTVKPAFPSAETRRESSKKPRRGETKADAWERAEMAKIKNRYERLIETIASWENKKKKKARSKLDKTESEMEHKRMKALQRYRSDMESIDEIAGGARAQAEEKRRKEELKAKEKANIIRRTGKVPSTCSCF